MALALSVSAQSVASRRNPERLGSAAASPRCPCLLRSRVCGGRGVGIGLGRAANAGRRTPPARGVLGRVTIRASHASWDEDREGSPEYLGWEHSSADKGHGEEDRPGVWKIAGGVVALAVLASSVAYGVYSRRGAKEFIVDSVATLQQRILQVPSESSAAELSREVVRKGETRGGSNEVEVEQKAALAKSAPSDQTSAVQQQQQKTRPTEDEDSLGESGTESELGFDEEDNSSDAAEDVEVVDASPAVAPARKELSPPPPPVPAKTQSVALSSHAVQTSVIVPAAANHEHEQALSALQALKVIEPGVEAGGMCTRRDYARWLIATSCALAKSPAQKVLPAMYIDSVTELAFNDVSPQDPDFPYIQGLAEAGLISSNLYRHDMGVNARSTDGAVFLPDGPLSRQDLVSWKVALEGRALQATEKEELKENTGFIDIEQVSEDALPFIATDLAAGEQSIISTAFGYTRRLQPGKPVTKGQVAMALVTGDAADVVAEELARLEADDLAEAAVAAEVSMEARAQKRADEYFNSELKSEKDTRVSAEKRMEELQSEMDRLWKERDDERAALESAQVALQAERQLFLKLRQDLEEQLQSLTADKIEATIEKDRMHVLRKEAEEGAKSLAEKKTELEVEKKALLLARLWAEDEAKKARAHAKVLEEARSRWEGKGIQVQVHKDLDGDNIPALGWQYGSQGKEGNEFTRKPPVQEFLARARIFQAAVVQSFVHLVEAIRAALAAFREKAAESYQGVRVKGSESVQALKAKGTESVQAVVVKARTLHRVSSSNASTKAKEMQESVTSAAAGMTTAAAGVTSSLSEQSRKVADGVRGEARKVSDGVRGEARKLAGKFKSS